MRALGAALLCLGGLLGGLGVAKRLRRRALALWELEQTMALAGYSLACFCPPTGALAKTLAQTAPAAGAALFARLAAAMERAPQLDLDTLWKKALEGVEPAARPSLLSFGSVLGRYAAAEQAQAAERCRRELGALAAQAQEQSARSGRVYIAVGTALGAMAAVVMV